MSRLLNEPVLLAGAIRAIIYAAGTFGFALTNEQTLALIGVVEAVSALVTRALVTPNQLAEHRVAMGGSPTKPLGTRDAEV